MVVNTPQGLDRVTLAEHLAGASTAPPPAEPVLARFVARHWGSAAPSKGSLLPSGLEPDEAAELAAGLAAALHETPYPLTHTFFNPENIQVSRELTGWKVNLAQPEENPAGTTAPEPGPALTEKAQLAAFGGMLYRLAVGQGLAQDRPGQKAQLAQLRSYNPYLTAILEDALTGHFASPGALAGGFGWSLYRQSYLNYAPVPDTGKKISPRHSGPQAVLQLPAEPAARLAGSRTRGGPLALVSLAIALVLLAGTVAFSVSGLESDYRPQSPAVTRSPAPTAAPSPTRAVAQQISRQPDGASLTRYNPAFDQFTGQYTDPAKITTGYVLPLSDFRSLRVQTARWAADGKRVDLALEDGGWESWDVPAKKRLVRKELPNAEQYRLVSWSPDGQNFAASGLDGQLRLGKGERVLRTVTFPDGQGIFPGPSGAAWPFSWSPDGTSLLVTLNNDDLQLWNLQSLPAQVEPPKDEATPAMSLQNSNQFSGIAWSPDGQNLARLQSGPDGPQIGVYNSRNLARLYVLKIPPEAVPAARNVSATVYTSVNFSGGSSDKLAWSPDGRHMALMREFTTTTLDQLASNTYSFATASQITILEIPGPPGLLATSKDKTVPFYPSEPVTPTRLETLSFPVEMGGQILSWSRDNRLLVAGSLPVPGNTGQPASTLLETRPYQALIIDLQTAGGGWKWQVSGQYELPFRARPGFAGWLPDEKRILFNSDRNLLGVSQLPDQPGKAMATEVLNKESTAGYAAYTPSPDGQSFVVRQADGKQFVRDSASGQVYAELTGPATLGIQPGIVSWSPDGQYLAVPYYSLRKDRDQQLTGALIIRAWHFERGKPLALVGDLLVPGPPDTSTLDRMEWAGKDGPPALLFKFAVTGVGRWEITRPIISLDLQRQAIEQQRGRGTSNPPAYFELAGRTSLWNNLGGVQVWFPDHQRLVNVHAGNYAIQELSPPDAAPDLEKEKGIPFEPQPSNLINQDQTGQNLAISPDSRMVAVGLRAGLLSLYNAANGKLFSSFTAHKDSLLSLGFSPDGHFLATSSSDRTVKVWDTTSWRLRAVLRLSNSEASGLVWLPDNKTLAVTNSYRDSTLLWRALP